LKTNIYSNIEFFYKKFYINKNVLTPRLETESLIREVLKIINKDKTQTLIDVWTWSWIIAISIMLNSDVIKKCFALDNRKKALKIWLLNSKNLNTKIEFIYSDLLSCFFKKKFCLNKNLIITANLPYIKDNDTINIGEDLKLEPKNALFWWKKTWFELYKKLIKQCKLLKDLYKIKNLNLICEIWFDQKEIAIKFINKIWWLKYEFFKDLRNIDRILNIKY
jgi:release factor glutamine methyltransferase